MSRNSCSSIHNVCCQIIFMFDFFYVFRCFKYHVLQSSENTFSVGISLTVLSGNHSYRLCNHTAMQHAICHIHSFTLLYETCLSPKTHWNVFLNLQPACPTITRIETASLSTFTFFLCSFLHVLLVLCVPVHVYFIACLSCEQEFSCTYMYVVYFVLITL